MGDVRITYRADDRTGPASRKAAKNIGSVDSATKGLLRSAAAFAGGTALLSFFKDSIRLATEQEAAEKKLEVALRRTGDASAATMQSMKLYASALQDSTAYGDEAILQAQALLVNIGGIGKDALPGATEATLNWAAALGKDLNSAAMDMGKALSGNVMMLQRYGVKIDAAKVKTEGASAVIEAINEQFGGEAQARMDTVAGKIEALTNAWGDFQERLGAAVTETAAFNDVLLLLTDTLKGDALANFLLGKETTGADEFKRRAEERADQVRGLQQSLANFKAELKDLQDGTTSEIFPGYAESLRKKIAEVEAQLPAARKAAQAMKDALAPPATKGTGTGATTGTKKTAAAEKEEAGFEGTIFQALAGFNVAQLAGEVDTANAARIQALNESRAAAMAGDETTDPREIPYIQSLILEKQMADEASAAYEAKALAAAEASAKQVEEADKALDKMKETQERLRDQTVSIMQSVGMQAGAVLMRGIVEGARGEEDAFKNTMKGLLPLIFQALGAGVGLAAGNPMLGAGIGGTIGGGLAGLFHQGGIVGAPYAHQGMAVTGRLKRDEVPIIAQTGEVVVRRESVAAMGGPEAAHAALNGGGGMGGGVTINVSAVDAASVDHSLRYGSLGEGIRRAMKTGRLGGP